MFAEISNLNKEHKRTFYFSATVQELFLPTFTFKSCITFPLLAVSVPKFLLPLYVLWSYLHFPTCKYFECQFLFSFQLPTT